MQNFSLHSSKLSEEFELLDGPTDEKHSFPADPPYMCQKFDI